MGGGGAVERKSLLQGSGLDRGEGEKKEEEEGNMKGRDGNGSKLVGSIFFFFARAASPAGCDRIIRCLEGSGALRRADCVLASYLNKGNQETADFTQHAPLLCVSAALSTSFCCFLSRTNPRRETSARSASTRPTIPLRPSAGPSLCSWNFPPQLRREIGIIPGVAATMRPCGRKLHVGGG